MHIADPALTRVVDQVNAARASGSPLEIRGGLTKQFYGELPQGTPLETAELSGISSYEPTELVVTARAGTRLCELEAALEERGQFLPFEPPRFAPGGTLGGTVAAGLAGPGRASAGSVRDHVLGATLLNGRGELLTFGGQVAKNVAGYDVARLLVGSLGILGVICEVSLKVLPASVASASLCFEWDQAGALGQLCAWAAKPLPITASAWHAGRLHLRLAGAQAAVSAACRSLGGTLLEPAAAQAWWTGVRDQSHEFFACGQGAGAESLWRVSVPTTTPPLELADAQLIEWGGAQRWCKTSLPPQRMRELAARAGGHATLMRGAERRQVFAPLNAVLMQIHRGLKDSFDPERIFNPGRLYAGL